MKALTRLEPQIWSTECSLGRRHRLGAAGEEVGFRSGGRGRGVDTARFPARGEGEGLGDVILLFLATYFETVSNFQKHCQTEQRTCVFSSRRSPPPRCLTAFAPSCFPVRVACCVPLHHLLNSTNSSDSIPFLSVLCLVVMSPESFIWSSSWLFPCLSCPAPGWP